MEERWKDKVVALAAMLALGNLFCGNKSQGLKANGLERLRHD